MAILFSMPVLAADNSPELLVTKGQNANQVNLSLTNLGDKTIKGFSLELKISGDGAAFTGTIQAGSALSTEDSRVKIITRNDGKEATLAVTRKGQLPAGKIDIGTLTVKGKAGEKYTVEASQLEMVDVSDYQKSRAEIIGLDKDSDDNLVIEHQDTADPDQSRTPDQTVRKTARAMRIQTASQKIILRRRPLHLTEPATRQPVSLQTRVPRLL